jgi:hypothetical protein
VHNNIFDIAKNVLGLSLMKKEKEKRNDGSVPRPIAKKVPSFFSPLFELGFLYTLLHIFKKCLQLEN